ncbi:hypothetical protein ACWEE1_14535 [Nocardia sp. NPDC004823]
MSSEPERRVELGKDRVVPRVQDAPAPTERMWTDGLPPAELPPPPPAPAVPQAEAPWAGVARGAPPVEPLPPAVPQAQEPWAGVERAAPPVELPPYPAPPPVVGPMFPRPAYPPAVGYPGYAPPAYGPPQPLAPRYGYVDSTPIWSIISFCCVAASVLGGLMLCGLPVLVTAPTGIVLGVVGHAKGEQMGKWAAIANGAVAALAVLLFVLFVAAIGGA